MDREEGGRKYVDREVRVGWGGGGGGEEVYG